jgi:hypothetical protein
VRALLGQNSREKRFFRAVPNDKHGDTQPAAILDLLLVEKRELQTAHHTNRAKQKRPEF